MSMFMHKEGSTERKVFCLHCTTLLEDDIKGKFCCPGCEIAFEFINDLNLGRYYNKKESYGFNSLLNKKSINYEIFDHEQYLKEFSEFHDDGTISSYFYLANLDCYACVWVCEKALKKLYPDIRACVNLSQKNYI